jgi:RNA polymerase sigma-54 factor
MKLSLQLKLGQQLTMTPQLQQAIKLLQLSTLDVQQEIQEALETNPMLEVDEEFDGAEFRSAAGDEGGSNSPNQEHDGAEATSTSEGEDYAEAPDFNSDESWSDQDIPEDLSVDTSWDDIYVDNQPMSSGSGGDSDENSSDFETRNSAGQNFPKMSHWEICWHLLNVTFDSRLWFKLNEYFALS